METAQVRLAQTADAEAIAAIYNEGIEGREATFERELRRASDLADRIGSPSYPLLVAELDGRVVGCAWIAPYSDRSVYAGVGECSAYVTDDARGMGIGTKLAEQLADEAEQRGFYKLLGKLFTTNLASVRLVRRCGFREVGLHRCHGRLDGEWRDVLLVERLLGEASRAARDSDAMSERERSGTC